MFTCLVEFTCKDIWSWTFVGGFLITESIFFFLLVVDMFNFLILFCFSFGSLCVSRNFWGCPVCLYLVSHYIIIVWISVALIISNSWFYYLSHFSSFWKIWPEIYQFHEFFQRTSSSIHWAVLLYFYFLYHLFLL